MCRESGSKYLDHRLRRRASQTGSASSQEKLMEERSWSLLDCLHCSVAAVCLCPHSRNFLGRSQKTSYLWNNLGKKANSRNILGRTQEKSQERNQESAYLVLGNKIRKINVVNEVNKDGCSFYCVNVTSTQNSISVNQYWARSFTHRHLHGAVHIAHP